MAVDRRQEIKGVHTEECITTRAIITAQTVINMIRESLNYFSDGSRSTRLRVERSW